MKTEAKLSAAPFTVATVATKECEAGLQRAVASLRFHGYLGNIDVYVPAGYTAPTCTGIEIIPCDNWWENMPGASKEKHNVPALAKPAILLNPRYTDGQQVLYFDGADVLFFEHPEHAFKIQTKPIMAYTWLNVAVAAPLTDKMPEAPYFNNGIWSFIAGPEARRFGHAFAAMAIAGIARNIWTTGKRRPIVGDQEAFNAAATMLPEMIQPMPHEMNYRGGTNVRNITVVNNIPMSLNNLPVVIAHATGGQPIRQDLINLATTGSTGPIWLTRTKFNEITRGKPYWKNRWEYHDIAIKELKSAGVENTIEFGARECKLAANAISVDIDPATSPNYILDLNDLNSPTWDRLKQLEIDGVVALQLLEHLAHPTEVWQNMYELAKKILVVSIPYKWTTSKSVGHNNIDEDVVLKWSKGAVWNRMFIIGNRAVFVWLKGV